MQIILIIFLTSSLIVNLYLIYRLKQKVKKSETYDAKALLSDLMRGAALVEIRRLDPDAIFIRSPRDIN